MIFAAIDPGSVNAAIAVFHDECREGHDEPRMAQQRYFEEGRASVASPW